MQFCKKKLKLVHVHSDGNYRKIDQHYDFELKIYFTLT